MGKGKKEKRRPLSLPEFAEKYGTERQCQEDLFDRRFGAGGGRFICPKCGHNHGSTFWRGERKIMKCSKCRYQMSAIEYCFLRIRRAKKSAGRAEAHPRVGCGENSVCETAVGEAGVLYAVLTAPLG